MTNEEYHNHPALSYSKLSAFRSNPRQYYRQYILGVKDTDNDALRLGSAFDCYLTEPEKFKTDWELKDTKTTKVNGCYTKDELAMFVEMAKSIREYNAWDSVYPFGNYNLGEIIDISTKQKKIFWNDGIDKRGMLDFFLDLPSIKIIIDLKTTKETTIEGVMKSIYNYNYFLQAVMYIDGIKQLYNLDVEPLFYFVFVSKKTYETFVVKLDDDYLCFARGEVQRLTAELKFYEENNLWLQPKICQTITLPYWLNSREDS